MIIIRSTKNKQTIREDIQICNKYLINIYKISLNILQMPESASNFNKQANFKLEKGENCRLIKEHYGEENLST